MKEVFPAALRLFGVLTLLTGIVYPVLVTLIGHVCFEHAAGGSLIECNGRVAGSSLLSQKFTEERYFSSRPSAVDFATVPSGASNLGPTSKILQAAVAERRSKLGVDAPDELLTASGSGLDPHLSPESARFQARRVARARGVPLSKITTLIEAHLERPQLGFLGEPRVNVLLLNLALDDLH